MKVESMNLQQKDAYEWWVDNQKRDFDSMSHQELFECCKEQDKLYLIFTTVTEDKQDE